MYASDADLPQLGVSTERIEGSTNEPQGYVWTNGRNESPTISTLAPGVSVPLLSYLQTTPVEGIITDETGSGESVVGATAGEPAAEGEAEGLLIEDLRSQVPQQRETIYDSGVPYPENNEAGFEEPRGETNTSFPATGRPRSEEPVPTELSNDESINEKPSSGDPSVWKTTSEAAHMVPVTGETASTASTEKTTDEGTTSDRTLEKAPIDKHILRNASENLEAEVIGAEPVNNNLSTMESATEIHDEDHSVVVVKEHDRHCGEQRDEALTPDVGETEGAVLHLSNDTLSQGKTADEKTDTQASETSEKNSEPDGENIRHRRVSLQSSAAPQSVTESSITGGQQPRINASRPRDGHQRLQKFLVREENKALDGYTGMHSVKAVLQGGSATAFGCYGDMPRHKDPQAVHSLLQAAQLFDSKRRFPNQQIFKLKIVLLGYQEVGKTSLRKCFESEPYFFKRLPDVKTTTGVEVNTQGICVGADHVQLIFSDFAGQEAYHSHTLFLTDRSIFLLVWKISAVEQDFQSSGISVSEEERLYKWIADVYAKFPRAKIVLVATHLDELRVQGQRSVERILAKVEGKIMDFMQRIAAVDPDTGTIVTNKIVGNFAVSCKTRRIIAAGGLRHLSGQKLSALLRFFAEVAHKECMDDVDFPSAAIPGRHIQIMKELEENKKRFPQRLLMPLIEFRHLALQFGVNSDKELLQIARLMHSWNIIYLFNFHRLEDDGIAMFRPLWLSRLAAALFSYAHVLRTPLHLRSIIGGLEYIVSRAEAADMHLIRKGFLRWPLVRVLFRQPLHDVLKREPVDSDYKMALELLVALDLLYPVDIPCDEFALMEEETPVIDPEAGRPIIHEPKVTRYFIPSLSPYVAPARLKRLAPVLFNRGAKVKFEFNLLPSEMWWRFQAQLQKYQQVITLHEPHGALSAENDEDVLDHYRLLEADEEHNRWIDAMWLRGDHCRVFLYREGLHVIRIFSTEAKPQGAEEVLAAIERVMSDLLEEYRGLRRTVEVACPEPSCSGWLMASDVATEVKVMCHTCKQFIDTKDIVASGVGPRGSRHVSDALLEEAGELLYFSLNHRGCVQMCEYLGVAYRRPNSLGPDDTNNISNNSNDDDVPMEQHLDFMYALDKVVSAALLHNQRERVEEEARRRRMLEHAPLSAPCLSY